ncbi:MAG: nucleotide exchange factor GrpE [Candidatus Babeliales bacterium]
MSDETKLNQELEEQAASELQEEQTELQKVTQERDEWKDKCLRLAADYDNFKKRTAKERIQWQQLITGKVLQDVLSLLDDVDRATSAKADPQQALQVLHKQLSSLLQSHNVKEMTDIKHFDPLFHEAVAHVPSDKHTSGDIIEVLQKGYYIGNEVLRPAKVAVAQ